MESPKAPVPPDIAPSDVASGRWRKTLWDRSGQLSSAFSSHPAGRQALTDASADSLPLMFGFEVSPGGSITPAGTTKLGILAGEAGVRGLQLRVELIVDGYDVREVDYAAIHSVEPVDIDRFVDALDLDTGQHALDLFCGYGAIGQRILQRCPGALVTFADLHQRQLDRIPPSVASCAAAVQEADARSLPFADSTFDAVAIKMGMHEVNQWDQSAVCAEVHRVLRPGGKLAVWDVMPEDGPSQDAFNNIMQVKNALAGYESLVRDRYFFRLDQLFVNLSQAGFSSMQKVYDAKFRQSTLSRRDSELGGSDEKLKALNDYIRRRLTADQARAMAMNDRGNDILLTVPNPVVLGHKPT
ncbi:class I SAM-dependent methyltransferase [Streptomyces sp. NPDC058251]|uniref:class I SAM-dependent methyltransferase n=1 Tax=unclassified Streptomyces TaxID=2593676 RepID=UPI003668B6F7